MARKLLRCWNYRRAARERCWSSALALAVILSCSLGTKKPAAWSSPPVSGGPSDAALPQRRVLVSLLGSTIAGSQISSALAEGDGKVRLSKVIAENGLEDWKVDDYQAMVDDKPRTEGYEAAIKKRVAKLGSDAVVIDIGTGAFALLAIMAAKAGAKKVYAIEKNVEAAKLATQTVQKEGLQDKIQVIQGDAMQVEVPEKADLIVSELIGSIASQEGLTPIIVDANKRFLKPGGSMIPSRSQTFIAPVKYTEHRIMDFAKKRGVLSRGKAAPGTLQPLRLRGSTKDLIFLAEPQLLEDFEYANPGDSAGKIDRQLHFEISKKKADDAKDFSGFAMWPKVVIDDEFETQVKGQKRTSHWAYVVALMSETPFSAAAPGSIDLSATVDYASSPVRYAFDADVTTA
eukprot:TRINITY_DN122990_c0_g1_i1.p1 TRINITY_DN122990_c0_g1~~TRINITY_DN122990_c0_g1_i1.p1  ORF type:complete len:402 (-),score=97.01 TRINITY_DN122990_c0_g1_i1:91-1296(-)